MAVIIEKSLAGHNLSPNYCWNNGNPISDLSLVMKTQIFNAPKKRTDKVSVKNLNKNSGLSWRINYANLNEVERKLHLAGRCSTNKSSPASSINDRSSAVKQLGALRVNTVLETKPPANQGSPQTSSTKPKQVTMNDVPKEIVCGCGITYQLTLGERTWATRGYKYTRCPPCRKSNRDRIKLQKGKREENPHPNVSSKHCVEPKVATSSSVDVVLEDANSIGRTISRPLETKSIDRSNPSKVVSPVIPLRLKTPIKDMEADPVFLPIKKGKDPVANKRVRARKSPETIQAAQQDFVGNFAQASCVVMPIMIDNAEPVEEQPTGPLPPILGPNDPSGDAPDEPLGPVEFPEHMPEDIYHAPNNTIPCRCVWSFGRVKFAPWSLMSGFRRVLSTLVTLVLTYTFYNVYLTLSKYTDCTPSQALVDMDDPTQYLDNLIDGCNIPIGRCIMTVGTRIFCCFMFIGLDYLVTNYWLTRVQCFDCSSSAMIKKYNLLSPDMFAYGYSLTWMVSKDILHQKELKVKLAAWCRKHEEDWTEHEIMCEVTGVVTALIEHSEQEFRWTTFIDSAMVPLSAADSYARDGATFRGNVQPPR